MRPIGSRKRFLKPLLLRLNAHMLDATIPVYFPEVTLEHMLYLSDPPSEALGSAKYPNPARRKVCTELLGN